MPEISENTNHHSSKQLRVHKIGNLFDLFWRNWVVAAFVYLFPNIN